MGYSDRVGRRSACWRQTVTQFATNGGCAGGGAPSSGIARAARAARLHFSGIPMTRTRSIPPTRLTPVGERSRDTASRRSASSAQCVARPSGADQDLRDGAVSDPSISSSCRSQPNVTAGSVCSLLRRSARQAPERTPGGGRPAQEMQRQRISDPASARIQWRLLDGGPCLGP